MSLKKKKTGKQAGARFTAVEREAMRDRVRELKGDRTDGEAAVLAKIAQMKEPDRTMARRVHEVVMAAGPALTPRTWYGMPAWATGGKVLCFFQSGQKFKTRYATFGFSDQARLDDGHLWPTGFALSKLTPVEEARIAALVRQALG